MHLSSFKYRVHFRVFQSKKPPSSSDSPGSQQVNGIYRRFGRTKPARRRNLQSLSRSLERHFNFSDPVSLKTLARNYSICFFNRGKRGRTRKVQNIMHNPCVAYTVDENNPDLFAMHALQVEGKASIITDVNELREIGEILAAKFPIAAYMPADPDAILIKIEPEVIYYLDYSAEFGHREKIDL